MYGGGYKARSVGSLVGLFLNDGTSAYDLSSNHAYGVINSDHATFDVGTTYNGIVSTSGYGAYNAGSKTYATDEANQTPYVIGCTNDLVNNGTYYPLWNMPHIEPKPNAGE